MKCIRFYSCLKITAQASLNILLEFLEKHNGKKQTEQIQNKMMNVENSYILTSNLFAFF